MRAGRCLKVRYAEQVLVLALVPRQVGSVLEGVGAGELPGVEVEVGAGLGEAVGSTTAPLPVLASLMMIGSSARNFSNRMSACS